MTTLLTREVPDGVAKRLARVYGFRYLRLTGEVEARLPEIVRLTRDSGEFQKASRDWHGTDADLRALLYYVETNVGRGPVEGWAEIPEDDDVVPWAYGRFG